MFAFALRWEKGHAVLKLGQVVGEIDADDHRCRVARNWPIFT